MMRILFLSQIIPFPLDAGPKVKTWNGLQYLANCGHQITFVSFVRQEETAHLPALQALCTEVHGVPFRRNRLLEPWYWVNSLVKNRPYLIERDDRAAMRELIARLMRATPFDVIHADQVTMTQFALTGAEQSVAKRPVLIFDAHNADWVIFDRYATQSRFFLKPLLSNEARHMKRYEGELVKKFDYTLTVSEPDSKAMLEAGRLVDSSLPASRVKVIPIAVNTQALQPVERSDSSYNILTLGTLQYPPNADGIRWFLNEVFPIVRSQVPQATLTIIGKRPPKDFVAIAEREPGIFTVPGYVPDLTEWLRKAAVLVVPVRVGGGMRVRILEAFAYGMPVVTTTTGLEGIEAAVGRDVFVADTPETFSLDVIRLLKDRTLQECLAFNGRKLAEEQYDWNVVLRRLKELYLAIEAQRTKEG